MAYTRWSSNAWYSFWRSDSPSAKEEQVLALWYNIDDTKEWTYEELKRMSVEDITVEYAGVPHNHIMDAMVIIKLFIEDVDQEFKMEYNK